MNKLKKYTKPKLKTIKIKINLFKVKSYDYLNENFLLTGYTCGGTRTGSCAIAI